ncbi:MAG: NAD-dependent epimerase/dehydratase family protein [Verrucomicrobia bacterium]|nr:NAD-dependent epimerase/dehydratase family protein [Verrucomicrobiota bacterium]
MEGYPEYFQTEEALEEALSRPASELIQMMKSLVGDILFLGVSGKMGISMACMAKRACEEAGIQKRIVGVSRFSAPDNKLYLEERGIEIISGDLLNQEFVQALPDIENVIYLAGTKFGTKENTSLTWAMNAYLPGLIVEKFKTSRIVALSTGCVYPLVDTDSGGSSESDALGPVGEYAQSCLGRERMFEFGSQMHGTRVCLVRLNYSVEMRYGVLVDIATKVANDEPVDVSMGYANVIWQGDANASILRSFQFCSSPPKPINVTGPETLSVRAVAKQFGKLFGREPQIVGEERETALLSNASWMITELGRPQVQVEQMINWTAKWIEAGNPLLGKPTHFEVRDGKY